MSEFFAAIKEAVRDKPPIETLHIPPELKLVSAYQIGQHSWDSTLIYQRKDGTFFERSKGKGDVEVPIPGGYEVRGVLQIGRTQERYYLLQDPAQQTDILKVRNDKLGEIPPLK